MLRIARVLATSVAWSLSSLYDDRYGLPTIAVVRLRAAAIILRARLTIDRTVPWRLRARRLGTVAAGVAAALVLTVTPASAVYQLSQLANGKDGATLESPLFIEIAGDAAVPLIGGAAVHPTGGAASILIGDAVALSFGGAAAPLVGGAAAHPIGDAVALSDAGGADQPDGTDADDVSAYHPLFSQEGPDGAAGDSDSNSDSDSGSGSGSDSADSMYAMYAMYAIGVADASTHEAGGVENAPGSYVAGTPAQDAGDFAFAGGVGATEAGLADPVEMLAGHEQGTPIADKQGTPIADKGNREEPLLAIQAQITQLPTTESVGAYAWPANGTLFSRFGSRDAELGSTDHKGIDISGHSGDPIYAADGGEVIVSERNGSYGNVIHVRHDNGQVTLYAHCSELLVSAGEWVAQGQQIALMGRTGLASGVHLHFEVIIDGKNVDPLKHLAN